LKTFEGKNHENMQNTLKIKQCQYYFANISAMKGKESKELSKVLSVKIRAHTRAHNA